MPTINLLPLCAFHGKVMVTRKIYMSSIETAKVSQQRK